MKSKWILRVRSLYILGKYNLTFYMSHIYDNIFQGNIEGNTLILSNKEVHYITVIRIKH